MLAADEQRAMAEQTRSLKRPDRPVPRGIPRPPARADARRNFARLVSAADEVFAEKGTDASLDEIARRAELGSGTLYRHFPTRDSLLTAVFWGRVEEACERGDSLLEELPPDEALIGWLRILLDLTMQRGLAGALMGEGASDLFATTRQALEATTAPVLENARSAGTFRADLVVGEVVTFAHAIAMCALLQPEPAKAADRLLTLLVDGLRRR
jgi:AcrR family transcriptional regulator